MMIITLDAWQAHDSDESIDLAVTSSIPRTRLTVMVEDTTRELCGRPEVSICEGETFWQTSRFAYSKTQQQS